MVAGHGHAAAQLYSGGRDARSLSFPRWDLCPGHGSLKITYFDLKSITKENGIAILISLVLFVAFLVVWNLFHYIAASLILSLGLGLLYKMKPVPAVILAVAYSVSTYLVFSKVLNVMLDF